MAQLRPIQDRVLVLRDKPDETTDEGIIIPTSSLDTPKSGTVLAIGCGRCSETGEIIPPQIDVGDRVMFNPYAGNPTDPNKPDELIMSESDILAVFDTETA